MVVAVTTARSGGPFRVADGGLPHDIDAEESLLGAMLLSDAACRAAMEHCGPGDFYRPVHGHIYQAIEHLVVAGRPVDPVTVMDEIHRLGLEKDIDGAMLIHLQVNTPSTSNAVSYAEIVAGHARRRDQIHVIAELDQAIRAGDIEAEARLRVRLESGAPVGPAIVADDIASLMRSPANVVEPELLHRSDGRALLTRGQVHILFGEPEAGKSFVTTEAARQILADGGRVVMLDYEGTPARIAQRLVQLGAAPVDVEERLLYLRPGGAPEAKLRSWMAAIVRVTTGFHPDLVVLDSLAAVLYEFGLKENDADGVLVPLRGLCRPMAAAGAAVVAIDHVKKETEGRDQWGRGSGAKRGEVDSSFHLKVQTPFALGKNGNSIMRVAKDRDGVLGGQGSVIANVTFGTDLAERFHITLLAPSTEEATYVGPTRCMDSVVELLEMRAPDELSARQITASLRAVGKSFRDTIVREAAERCAGDDDRPVVVRTGPRGARLYRFSPQPVVDPEEEF